MSRVRRKLGIRWIGAHYQVTVNPRERVHDAGSGAVMMIKVGIPSRNGPECQQGWYRAGQYSLSSLA